MKSFKQYVEQRNRQMEADSYGDFSNNLADMSKKNIDSSKITSQAGKVYQSAKPKLDKANQDLNAIKPPDMSNMKKVTNQLNKDELDLTARTKKTLGAKTPLGFGGK